MADMTAAAGTPALAPDKIDTVLEIFRAAGHTHVSPPILQPADVLLDLIGEDIRRRLYLTSGSNGTDLCLRPDFTIPVCRHHLARENASLPTGYCYHGPVFRQRPDGLGEIMQIGAESLGRTDTAKADADLLALSVSALNTFGQKDLTLRIGDEALFSSVLAGLDLPVVWRRRLRGLFGEPDKLNAAIERMAGDGTQPDEDRDVRLGFLSALEGADPKAAHAVVEDLLSIAGISAVGGRTPSEIAERFLEQAALARGTGGHDKAAETLKEYLAIETSADEATARLNGFAEDHSLEIGAPIKDFSDRLDAIAANGIAPQRLSFATRFGRRLDYYSGFIFEIYPSKIRDDGPLAGGGRYDRLVTLLGAQKEVPAVGFSMWLDRIAASTGGKA